MGVGLCLEPELIPAFHAGADTERSGLAGSDDDVVVLRCGDGARAVAEPAGKEVVPRRKAPVRVRRVVLVLLDADRLSGGVACPSPRVSR